MKMRPSGVLWSMGLMKLRLLPAARVTTANHRTKHVIDVHVRLIANIEGAAAKRALRFLRVMANRELFRNRAGIVARDGLKPIANGRRVVESPLANLSYTLLRRAQSKREPTNGLLVPAHQANYLLSG